MGEAMKVKEKKGLTSDTKKSEKGGKTVSARDRIKPRGLSGKLKGKIHYDRNSDIFNLGPL